MRPQAWWTPIGLFAVIGPSRKLQRGPPGVLRPEPRERPPLGPLPEQVVLLGDEVGAAGDGCEHRASEGSRTAARAGLASGSPSLSANAARPAPARFPRRDVSFRAMSTPPRPPRAPRTRSAFAAAFLSLLFPGLGHAYAGALDARARLRRAAAAVARAARRGRPARRPASSCSGSSSSSRSCTACSSSTSLILRVPDRRGDRRLERRALPQRRRRVGHGPRRPREAADQPALDRRPARRRPRHRRRARRGRPLQPPRDRPRELRVHRERGPELRPRRPTPRIPPIPRSPGDSGAGEPGQTDRHRPTSSRRRSRAA